MRVRQLVRAGLATTLAFAAGMAGAQTPSPLPEWTYSSGMLLRNHFGGDQLPKWDFNVGLAGEFQPKYDGSQDYRIQGGPNFDIRYRNIAFLATGEGLGWNIIHSSNARAGLAITYDLGRSDVSSSVEYNHGVAYRERPVGSVNPGPEVKAFGEYLFFPIDKLPLTVRADVRRAIGGYNGWVADFAAYMPVVGSEKFFVFIGPAITFADKNYMQNYFGVTSEQSTESSYPIYTPEGGVKEISFGTSATWFFTKHWYTNVTASAAHLVDDAANSPTTEEKIQGAVSLDLGYSWHH